MKRLSIGVLVCVSVGFSVSASGGLIVDPVGKNKKGHFQIGVHNSSATTAYLVDCDGCGIDGQNEKSDTDIIRNGVTIYGAYGVGETLDLYFGTTYNLKSEIENFDGRKSDISGDSGFEIGVGLRARLVNSNSIKLISYAQLEYITDDLGTIVDKIYYSGGDWDEYVFTNSASGMELSGGLIGLFKVRENLSVYAGLELVPFGTIEMESKFESSSYSGGTVTYNRDDSVTRKDDVERDKLFGIRVGARYMVDDGVFVRGEFSAMGERSVTFGGGVDF